MSNELAKAIDNENAIVSTDWRMQRDGLIDTAKRVVAVNDSDTLAKAGAVYTEATRLIKELATRRLELTRPLDAAKKQIMDAEKTAVAALESEQKRVNALMSDYATRQAQAAREEARRREQEAAEAAEAEACAQAQAQKEAEALFGPEAVVAAPPPVSPVQQAPAPYIEQAKTATNTFAKVTKFEVVAPAKVSREFMTVDETKIRKFLAWRKEMGDDMDSIVLDGIRVWQEVKVSAR
jgi:hypothetical protein